MLSAFSFTIQNLIILISHIPSHKWQEYSIGQITCVLSQACRLLSDYGSIYIRKIVLHECVHYHVNGIFPPQICIPPEALSCHICMRNFKTLNVSDCRIFICMYYHCTLTLCQYSILLWNLGTYNCVCGFFLMTAHDNAVRDCDSFQTAYVYYI